MPKVSLVGHHHTCPKSKHPGGPIISGQSGFTVNGVPIAVVGDSCACRGTDTITSGNGSITINGKAVAVEGSSTAHGGEIVQGCGPLSIG